jgi:hypothetical protein
MAAKLALKLHPFGSTRNSGGAWAPAICDGPSQRRFQGRGASNIGFALALARARSACIRKDRMARSWRRKCPLLAGFAAIHRAWA